MSESDPNASAPPESAATPAATSPPMPVKLKLKRDERLTVDWSDGRQTQLTIKQLRRACPCATCKDLRQQMSKSRLTVLPTTATATEPLTVARADLVGNYALRLTWSDGHDKGIYSFVYLRELAGA